MNKGTFVIFLVLEKMELYFNTNDRKLSLAIPTQEKLAASYMLATGRVSKAFIHLVCLSSTKMHCATRDEHMIKEKPLFINQTYWESYSIIQQIGPNSHWRFLANFLPISHMIWEIIVCYDFWKQMRNQGYSQSRREIIRFSTILVSPLHDFSPRTSVN